MDGYVEQEYNDMLYRIYLATEGSQLVRNINEDGQASPVTKDGVPIRKLFVGNLAERTNYKDLQKLFSQYGEIESCFLRRNQGKSNYAFVTFSSAEDAIKARIDGSKMIIRLHNRILRVTAAYTWHQPGNIENNIEKFCQKTDSTNDNADAKIHMLNDACLIHIFLYLPIIDKIRIERVCKRWRLLSQASWYHVKKLDLFKSNWGFSSHCCIDDIDMVVVRKVLLRCGGYLKEIHFSQIFHNLGSNILSIVGKLCPNLQVIDASSIFISPCSIESLTTNCRDIRSLSLGKILHFCDAELTKLFKQNTKLRYFMACDMIRGDCLIHLPAKAIEEIILPNSGQLNFDHLSRALSKFENLSTFAMHKCKLPFRYLCLPVEVLESLKKYCKQLRRLELVAVKFNEPRCRTAITELCNLEVLILQGTDINDEFLVQLSTKCQKLSYLDISGRSLYVEISCSITSSGIATLASLPNLEKLIINNIRGDTGVNEAEYQRDFFSLKHLECRECYLFSDSAISSLIEHSPQLELVDLSGCGHISEETFERVVAYTLTRKSKVVLKMFVGGTGIVHRCDVSPFLQVINVDLSKTSNTVPCIY